MANEGDLGPYMQIILDHWITGVLVIAVCVFVAVNFYNQRRKVNHTLKYFEHQVLVFVPLMMNLAFTDRFLMYN